MHYLTRDQLEALAIRSSEVIDYLEVLVRQQSQQQAMAAPKTVIAPADGRYLMATLSMSEEPPYMAVKSLLVNQQNSAAGGEAINASIILMHAHTGEPLAIMDGNWITGIRTAAASALAARYLARAEASSIAFIGCGVQARSHLQVFAEQYPLQTVYALGKGAKNRDALLAMATDMGMTAVACSEARQAVADADIIVSSIPLTSKEPAFIDVNWLKPGAFVAATDAGLPWLPASLTAFDHRYIDDRKQEAAMAKPMMPLALIDGDLGELLNGQVAARQNDQQRLGFIYRAVALGDLAMATLVYQKLQPLTVNI